MSTLLSTQASVNSALRYLQARQASHKLAAPVPLLFGSPGYGAAWRMARDARQAANDRRQEFWRHFLPSIPLPVSLTSR